MTIVDGMFFSPCSSVCWIRLEWHARMLDSPGLPLALDFFFIGLRHSDERPRSSSRVLNDTHCGQKHFAQNHPRQQFVSERKFM
ncbi:hypothetical protein GN956_G8799 [Arapaima gigas]